MIQSYEYNHFDQNSFYVCLYLFYVTFSIVLDFIFSFNNILHTSSQVKIYSSFLMQYMSVPQHTQLLSVGNFLS